MAITQEQREALERQFWIDSPSERPGLFAIDNILNKMGEAHLFGRIAARYRPDFANAATILELGGGQSWASCIVKDWFPDKRVIASDISEDAIASADIWEDIFRVELDGKLGCTSYDVPLEDGSLDLIFAFQAAHHFGAQDRTLVEARRLLRPGGTLLYLSEPVVGRLLYRKAVERVRRIRSDAYEDYLLLPQLREEAKATGLTMEAIFRSDIDRAGLSHAIYYRALRMVPALRHIVPHGADIRYRR